MCEPSCLEEECHADACEDGVGGHPKALGEGECDLDAVLDAAQAMGMEWLIVENDDPVPTGFEDITRSLAYIKSKLK